MTGREIANWLMNNQPAKSSPRPTFYKHKWIKLLNLVNVTLSARDQFVRTGEKATSWSRRSETAPPPVKEEMDGDSAEDDDRDQSSYESAISRPSPPPSPFLLLLMVRKRNLLNSSKDGRRKRG